MKISIFSVLLCSISSVMFSQSFEIHNLQGNDVTGSTQYVTGLPQSTLSERDYAVNSSASAKTVKVCRVEISLVPASYNNIIFDQIGYAPTIDTSIIASVVQPGDSVYFQGDYYANDSSGTSIIQYCFFDVNNPSDQSCFTVHYQKLINSISENEPAVEPVRVFPMPADAYVQFIVPAGYNGNVNLQLFDCSGRLVNNSNQVQSNFVLDLASFRNGMYYFRLTAEDGNTSFGKLQVLHSPN